MCRNTHYHWISHLWPMVKNRENNQFTGEFPHKGQWRRAFMFSLIFSWINGWVNYREAGDLIRHRAHYDVTVMWTRSRCLPKRNAELLWCQFCRHWCHHRFKLWQLTVPPRTTKLHWNSRIAMMPTLSLVGPRVYITTTSGAIGDDNVGNMTILI